MIPTNEQTLNQILEAIGRIDTDQFIETMEELTPMIPDWIKAHMRMERTFPSPSGILRCRLQQWFEGKKMAADQIVPVGWKIRRMMGIIQEPLWIAILNMADFPTDLPMDATPCGEHMMAHPDGELCIEDEIFPVEFKSISGVGFRKLIDGGGIAFREQDHYAQIQLYMHAMNASAGLYLATPPDPGLLQANMRTKKRFGSDYQMDPVYVEWVEYDAGSVEHYLERADMILEDGKSDEPPMREYSGIPENAKGKRNWPCGFCVHVDKCNDTFTYDEGEIGEEIKWYS